MSKTKRKDSVQRGDGTEKRVHAILRRKYRGAFPDGIVFYGYHHLYAYGPLKTDDLA